MKKQNENDLFLLVTSERLEDFYERGKRTAKLLDQGKHIQKRRIISFEDPNDLAKFLTANKLRLISNIRKKPVD